MEYEKVKNVYTLHNQMLENSKPNLRILHPLPRVNEIAYDVDEQSQSILFRTSQERPLRPPSHYMQSSWNQNRRLNLKKRIYYGTLG